MAGAVQVLDLSDDEDNSSCICITPHSQALSRSRPGIRQYTPKNPVVGGVACLDSDEEAEPIFSMLDDCCIVKEFPSCSRLDRKLKSQEDGFMTLTPSARVVDLDSQEILGMNETEIQLLDFSRRRVEIFSISEQLKNIPADDGMAEPHMAPGTLEEIERPFKRQKDSSLARPTCDAERQQRLREKELEFERKQAAKAEKKREKEEARKKLQDDVKRKKEEEKALKLSAKLAAQERRKADLEVARLNRRDALDRMIAAVDIKVAEKGSIGGQLLSRFVEKKLSYKLTANPIQNSIIWYTKTPRLESQEVGQSEDMELLQYVTIIFEAEEFVSMVAESLLISHVQNAQHHYPGCIVCYVVKGMSAFLQKRDQAQYSSNDLASTARWQRPHIEKALAGLTTNFIGVRSCLCVHEADVADHVTGLMQILAQALYKPKLTRLSVNKNGEHVRSGDPFKEEIQKSLWLKALVAIPKVSGACAVAIGKVYPCMRSLLKVYLDNSKTNLEKELLLKDLRRENCFDSAGGQRIGAVCSRQIYHILMAQNGDLRVDKIDEGVHEDRLEVL